MCGIFCSSSKEMLEKLAGMNAYRGSHSFSIFKPGGGVIRSLGAFDPALIEDGVYTVCHVQAPTTESRGIESVHPAQSGTDLLWHNGIVKDFDVTRLQGKQATDQSWDTMLLLNELLNGVENLSEVNGSFACVWWDGEALHVFRNEISPLFFDQSLNISSVKFAGSASVPPNKVLRLNFNTFSLDDIGLHFMTKENPYYFAK